MDSAQYFSTDFTDAARKFRAAAEIQGLEVTAWTHPERGPNGETLETLSCELGPKDAPNVLVLNSGTHGTEAFAGAGLLTGILADPAGFLSRAPQTRLVMIHMINPYGAAWGRYVNEDNVDLMKNLTYGDYVSPTDPIFLEFDDAMDLAGLTSPGAYAAGRTQRIALVETYGMPRLMHALKSGQSARPNSICYNGVTASWSKRTLDAILARTLSGARRVLFLDLHTGVGDFGEAYVMTAGDERSKSLVRAWLGEQAHESDVPMEPPTLSTLARFAPGADFAAAVMEGGTVTFDDRFNEAMWFEMHYHLFGDRSCAHALETKALFKSYYYPLSDDWRRLFWANGSKMICRFLEGLESWRAERVAA